MNDEALAARLEAWSKQPLTPSAYCQIWVVQKKDIRPDIWGYRKACLHELQQVLGLSRNTINCWGSNFERCHDSSTLLHLRRVHIYNVQMRVIQSLQHPVTGIELMQKLLHQLDSLELEVSKCLCAEPDPHLSTIA